MIIYSFLVKKKKKCPGTQGKDLVFSPSKKASFDTICQPLKGTEFDLQWDKNLDNDQTS